MIFKFYDKFYSSKTLSDKMHMKFQRGPIFRKFNRTNPICLKKKRLFFKKVGSSSLLCITLYNKYSLEDIFDF